MKITDFVPVSLVTENVVTSYLKQVGIDVTTIVDYSMLIKGVIESIQKSGKYQTMADLMADSEFVSSVKELIERHKSISRDDIGSSNDVFTIGSETILCCPSCRRFFTVDEMRKQNGIQRLN